MLNTFEKSIMLNGEIDDRSHPITPTRNNRSLTTTNGNDDNGTQQQKQSRLARDVEDAPAKAPPNQQPQHEKDRRVAEKKKESGGNKLRQEDEIMRKEQSEAKKHERAENDRIRQAMEDDGFRQREELERQRRIDEQKPLHGHKSAARKEPRKSKPSIKQPLKSKSKKPKDRWRVKKLYSDKPPVDSYGNRIAKKRHANSGTVALREIKKFQKWEGPLIPRLPFMRLVKGLMKELGDFKVQESAIDILQDISEQMLVTRFSILQYNAFHAKRITIMPADAKIMQLNLKLGAGIDDVGLAPGQEGCGVPDETGSCLIFNCKS